MPPGVRLLKRGRYVARLQLSAPFLDDLAALSEREEKAIWAKLALVEAFPGVGSSLLESQLLAAFGPRCLKISAAGYDIVYERIIAGDGEKLTRVYGLVPQRRVR